MIYKKVLQKVPENWIYPISGKSNFNLLHTTAFPLNGFSGMHTVNGKYSFRNLSL